MADVLLTITLLFLVATTLIVVSFSVLIYYGTSKSSLDGLNNSEEVGEVFSCKLLSLGVVWLISSKWCTSIFSLGEKPIST